jgi:hypothetical protein
MRCKSAVFCQTEQLLGIFSTGNEKGGFTGISDISKHFWKGKGARIGLICPQGPDPLFQMSPKKNKSADG